MNTNELLNKLIGKVNASVKTEAQTLTSAAQTQARNNIGAASQADVNQLSSQLAEIGTQEDIVQQVIKALGTPVFGTVDADNNIILTGALANGTYTVKYEDADGNVVAVGEISLADDSPYVELEYVYNTKIDKTTGAETTDNSYHTTNFVEYDSSRTYKVTLSSRNNLYIGASICWYDVNKGYIGWNDIGANAFSIQGTGSDFISFTRDITHLDGGVYFKVRIYSTTFKTQNGIDGGVAIEKV